jgi:ABC-type transporter Mla subunit MlaD
MKIDWGGRRLFGLLVAILAVVSLVIDAAGIVQVWVLREPVTRDASTALDLLSATLDTTTTGLVVAKTSLKSVTATIAALRATVSSTSATIENASASVSSVSTIVGKNLSSTVTSALRALDAVEQTTKTIDEVLSGLATLPFLNIRYDPAKPLSASVSDLSDQLVQVPQSLADLEKDLATSGSSLDKVGADAKTLAASLGQVENDMSQLVGVIEQYETQVKAFQDTVKLVRGNLVTIVWSSVLFATFVMFWLGVTMVQTLAQGLRWMGIVIFP